MNRFQFTGDLKVNLANLDDRMKRVMVAAAGYVAPQAEAYMRENAKWTDRTGAARNGLGATVKTSGDDVAIVLFHTVPYGVFLEVRWGGKYAIIEPTIAAMAPLYLQAIQRLGFGS